MSRPKAVLLFDSARGVYIPRDFATAFTPSDRAHVTGVESNDWAVLEAGPDNELYWDVWLGVCDSAIITDDNGDQYMLWQDGDLWLIPVGMTWDEEAEGYRWPLDNVVPFRRRENSR